MSGLQWTTAGESHGAALVGILEGLPAGLALDVGRIDAELARRQGGYGRGGRMKIESDRVQVLSGVRQGVTLGSPLALVIENKDATIDKLPVPPSPRPGHADLAGSQRRAEADPRAVLERASARETALRVALGAAARQVLEAFGVEVFGHVVALGGDAAGAEHGGGLGAARAFDPDWRARRAKSAFACLDASVEERWRATVDAAKEAGDTLGGVFEVVAFGLPPGLGSCLDPRDRLTARLAAAVMAVPAIKGVEIGLGFGAAGLAGSAFHDAIVPPEGAQHAFGSFGRSSNRAGGLEGGMTTGAPVVVRAAMKPISTLKKGLDTVAFGSGAAVRSTYQRSDVTAVPAASVAGEAVVALELAGAFLDAFGAPTLELVRERFEAWRAKAESL